MTLPNFLLIGAGKSGTTSLCYYLEQHPEVYMSPIKGPNFFAFEGREPDFRGPPGTPSPTLFQARERTKSTQPARFFKRFRSVHSPEKAKKSPNLVHLGMHPPPTGVYDTGIAWRNGILA